MENILSSLNSLAETWLAFGPAPCHVDLNYSLLSGLGLLLLSTCYLLLKVVLPSLWKKECTQKLQEKAKEARESLKGGRTGRRDTEEGRRLQRTLQSPLGKPYPDSLCNEAQLVLQPEAPLSLVESPRELSANVPTAKGTISKGLAVSASFQSWSSAKDQTLTKFPHTRNQQPVDPHAAQASDQRLTKTHTVEPGNNLSPTPDVLALFKRQEQTETDFTASEHRKEETESFSMPPNNSGKISASIAGPKNLEVSLPLGNEKDNAGDPLLLQQLSYPKTSEDQSDIKDTQLFWGLPSLHSESLKREAETSVNSSSVRADFNRMAKASTGNESPASTQPIQLPLPERDQQVWLQTLPESQTKPDSLTTSEAPQPQIQSPPPSPLPQFRDCGVHFHGPPDEAQPLRPSEIRQLEYNVLQKSLESLLGLPTVTQRSQQSFCPPPPKLSMIRKSFKFSDPKSILPGDYPLDEEVRRTLEHHLRKRLIQHLWGLPHRVRQSLSLMSPQPEPPELLEPQRSRGPSGISPNKHNASRHPSGVSQSESFPKKISETHPQKEKDMEVQRHDPEVDQKDHLQRDFHGATTGREHSESETDPELQPGNLSGKFAKPSLVKQCRKNSETLLRGHLSRTKEMSDSNIPATEDRVQHCINMLQPPPQTPHGQVRRLAPLAGEKDTLKQSLSLRPSKEKMLEEHIKTFAGKMTLDVPQRVEESLESYKTKVEPSHSLSQFCLPPDAAVSAVDSAQPSRFLQSNTSRNRMGTLNFMPIQETPLPVSRPVRQMRPASKNKLFVDKDLSTAQSGREPTQPWTPGVVDKGSRQQSGSDNRHSSELPMRPDGPTDERLASRTSTQGPQGERISRKDGSMAEGSTELLKREQLRGLHPQSTETLTATQDTCQPLQRMSVPHNPGTSVYKSQVSRGAVLRSESRLPRQAAGQPDVAPASGEMTSKRQGPSGGDMVSSQVLRVHLPTAGVSMEPRQGPWLPVHVSGKCQNKECPPAARRVSPLAAEAGKFGGGDAGLGTSQTRGKRHSVQARAPEETRGHTSSPALSRKGQPPQDQFSSPAKCFLQWMSPGRKHKGQERSLAKASSPSPSVKGTSLVKKRCEFYGNIEAPKSVRDPGVILRKPLGHRHGTVTPCPQAPVPPPLLGSAETQQEVQQLAQVKAVQRYHSRCQSARSQVQRAESCSPGQGQSAPERCGVAGRAEMMGISPSGASQGARVPPKSYL
ncbi:spermatogenesis-associated protein 31D3 [Phodopus roborovskii]|uniref:spermatogenesis-associated protein 31D3 n=1 Tax=Phodopus roborovskii TaxID=109678 RepID=UPI0021E37A37|nr:spermatogenesis-associated protein 31D3 [Phodopus roborovskii]